MLLYRIYGSIEEYVGIYICSIVGVYVNMYNPTNKQQQKILCIPTLGCKSKRAVIVRDFWGYLRWIKWTVWSLVDHAIGGCECHGHL